MIIVTQQVGRLGNQLQLFAHLIGCSLETGHGIWNPAFHQYHSAFLGTHEDALSRFPARARLRLSERSRRVLYRTVRGLDRSGILDHLPGAVVVNGRDIAEIDLESAPTILDHRIVCLSGGWAFRHWSGLKKNISKIRTFLSLVPPRAMRVESFLNQARSDAEILVGVHIRQTDFAEHRSGAYFFSTEEYGEIMRQICALFPARSAAFIVCSDTPHSSSQFPGLRTHHPIPDEFEDLFLLAGCDYIIGPAISSYSLIASMLGNTPRYGVSNPTTSISIEDFSLEITDSIAPRNSL